MKADEIRALGSGTGKMSFQDVLLREFVAQIANLNENLQKVADRKTILNAIRDDSLYDRIFGRH
jgi:hypothetical protein